MRWKLIAAGALISLLGAAGGCSKDLKEEVSDLNPMSDSPIPKQGTVLTNFKPAVDDYAAIDEGRAESVALKNSAGNGLLRDRALSAYLNGLLDKLVAAGPVPNLPARVYVRDTTLPNAHAANDGAIFITVGMLRNLKNEDQLAALLAHELAHVLYQDKQSDWWLEAQKRLISAQLLARDVSANVSREGTQEASADLNRLSLMSEAAHFVSDTAIAPIYQRDQEDRADLFSVDLLQRTDYRNLAMKRVAELLAEANKKLRERRSAARERLVNRMARSLGGDAELVRKVAAKVSDKALGAFEAAFGSDHRPPERRKKLIARYQFDKHAGSQSKKPVRLPWREPDGEMRETQVADAATTRRIGRLFENYATAHKAREALDEGERRRAVRLARQAVSGPTEHAPYPRMTFYRVRASADQDRKAWQNLKIGMQAPKPALVFYEKAIVRAARRGRPDLALQISGEAQDKLNDPARLWPWRIYLLDRTGRTKEAMALQTKCRLEYPGKLEQLCRFGPSGVRQGTDT